MALMHLAFKLYTAKAEAFEEATKDPESEQARVLFDCLKRNRSSEYGSMYDFGSISSIEDYQAKIPIVRYKDLKPFVAKIMQEGSRALTSDETIFFALTSGSTGRHKFIPVTEYSIKKKQQATSLWAYHIVKDYPQILDGKVLAVVSPEVEGYTRSGIPFGAESGHGYKRMPPKVREQYVLPYEVIEITDYDSKYYTILRLAAEENVTTIASLNPSTIVLLAQKLDEMKGGIIEDIEKGTLQKDILVPDNIRSVVEKKLKPNPQRAAELRAIVDEKKRLLPVDVWPGLQLIECWQGGSVGVYISEFGKYYDGVPVRDFGYLASEVRGSIPVRDNDPAGILAINLNFYEFIPREDICRPDARPLLAREVEKGKEYYIILTTPGGLYRYNIDDVIRVVGFHNNTPLVEFVQKGQNVCSVTGEKLYEEQVVRAVDKAVKKNKLPVKHFTACLQPGETYCYSFLVEFGEYVQPYKKKEFLKDIDLELCDINCEYESKRKSQRLCHPELKVVKSGEFDKLRSEKVKKGTPDGQFKLAALNHKMDQFDDVVIEEHIRL